MQKVGIIIQARMGSRRLPGKSLKPLGELLLIDWVIRVSKSVKGVDFVILATSQDDNCDELCNHLFDSGIEILRGSEKNVLDRYKSAIEKYKLDIAIRITGDDPCHDPKLVEKGLTELKKNNYDYLISSSKEMPLIDGLIFEIFTSDIFFKMYSEYKNNYETREHVTAPLRDYIMECKRGYIQKDFINPTYKYSEEKICVDTLQDINLLNECWILRKEDGIYYPDTLRIIKNIRKKSKIIS